ncbi:MAG: hypothetical protein Harvfovirus5_35 [Harvfovirus sp.]|uniref:Leucine-rich repeat protein n=1 Tax=Harvfovirus sp. TaxID=2487768 RepID=A0A3G5A3G6_9VIRU|nr:MAG: hypothetical protein Harvfovirus5_35 [Harvfovirus sp.]
MNALFLSHPVQILIPYLNLHEAFNFRQINRFCLNQTQISVRINIEFKSWDWAIVLHSIFPNIKLHGRLIHEIPAIELPLIESLKQPRFPSQEFLLYQTKLTKLSLQCILHPKIPSNAFVSSPNLSHLTMQNFGHKHSFYDILSGNLPNLTSLNLTGHTKDTSYDWVNSYTNLTALALSFSNIEYLSIYALTKLTSLTLESGLPVNLYCNFSKLVQLSLGSRDRAGNFSYTFNLRECTNLESFSLESVRINTLSDIYSLTRLTFLSLWRQTKIDLKLLGLITALQTLRITECKYTDEQIGTLTNLTQLTLNFCRLTLNSFSNMYKLQILNNYASIDFSKGAITYLRTLRQMDVGNCNSDHKKYFLSLTNLTHLSIEDEEFTEQELRKFPKLRVLNQSFSNPKRKLRVEKYKNLIARGLVIKLKIAIEN